jgi:hypothetical protein
LLQKTQWSPNDVILRMVFIPHQSTVPEYQWLQQGNEKSINITEVKLPPLHPAYGGSEMKNDKLQEANGTIVVEETRYALGDFADGVGRVAEEMRLKALSIVDDRDLFKKKYGVSIFTLIDATFENQTPLKADVDAFKQQLQEFQDRFGCHFGDYMALVIQEK